MSKKKTKRKTKSSPLYSSIFELICNTSTIIPNDIQKVILSSLKKEEKNTTAEYAMKIIKTNIELAKKKTQPLCQDTGTILFYVNHPKNFSQLEFTKWTQKAVHNATKDGYLRMNSVNIMTEKNDCFNVGPGHPTFYFNEHNKKYLEISLMLKGGGCENVSAQYSLPNVELSAGRDIEGVKKCILDAIIKAQGKGCGPGVLGICIGGDRGSGHSFAKKQLLRKLDDKNPNKELKKLEDYIVKTANTLGIGPMGFGGKTTLLGCKVSCLNRLPASYFVSISYMCWAYRRNGIILDHKNKIKKWLY